MFGHKIYLSQGTSYQIYSVDVKGQRSFHHVGDAAEVPKTRGVSTLLEGWKGEEDEHRGAGLDGGQGLASVGGSPRSLYTTSSVV